MENIISLICNIIFGIVFEILFIYYMIITIKNIKTNKIKLLIGVSLVYIISMILAQFNYQNQMWLYMSQIVLVYLLLKFIYKEEIAIPDIFIMNFILLIITFSGVISYILISTELGRFLFNRFSLIWIFESFRLLDFNRHYINYNTLWNRHDKSPIKAITIRNMNVIFLNLSIYIFNILLNIYLLQ